MATVEQTYILAVGRYSIGEKTHAIRVYIDSEGNETHLSAPICLSQRGVMRKSRLVSRETPNMENVSCEKCQRFGCVRS